MESAVNTTGSLHLFNGSFPFNETTPHGLVIAAMFCSIWIISSNLYILVCIVISRHALKHSANIQILSMSITDLSTGIFALLLTLSSNNIVSFPTFGACAVIWCGYNTSRAASFFHALGICIQRLRAIKRRTVQRDFPQQGRYKRLCYETSLIWVAAAVIMVVPFVVYGRLGKNLKQCSYKDMFGTDSKNVFIIIIVAYLTPQISMSVIYMYIVRFLLTKWRQTNITVPPTIPNASSEPDALGIVGGTNTTDVSDRRSVFHPSSSTETKTAYLKTEGNTSLNDSNADGYIPSTSSTIARQSTDIVHALEIKHLDSTKNAQTADNILSTSSTVVRQPKDTVQALEIRPPDIAKNFEAADKIPSTSNSIARQPLDIFQALAISPPDKAKSAKHFHNRGNNLRMKDFGNRSGFKYQKHVLLTIGLIILIMNICVIPFHFWALTATISGITPKNRSRGRFFWLSYLNSALNPFIYALRIKPLREVMKTTWNKCASFLNLCK